MCVISAKRDLKSYVPFEILPPEERKNNNIRIMLRTKNVSRNRRDTKKSKTTKIFSLFLFFLILCREKPKEHNVQRDPNFIIKANKIFSSFHLYFFHFYHPKTHAKKKKKNALCGPPS